MLPGRLQVGVELAIASQELQRSKRLWPHRCSFASPGPHVAMLRSGDLFFSKSFLLCEESARRNVSVRGSNLEGSLPKTKPSIKVKTAKVRVRRAKGRGKEERCDQAADNNVEMEKLDGRSVAKSSSRFAGSTRPGAAAPASSSSQSLSTRL